jgi:hypothetical protein
VQGVDELLKLARRRVRGPGAPPSPQVGPRGKPSSHLPQRRRCDRAYDPFRHGAPPPEFLRLPLLTDHRQSPTGIRSSVTNGLSSWTPHPIEPSVRLSPTTTPPSAPRTTRVPESWPTPPRLLEYETDVPSAEVAKRCPLGRRLPRPPEYARQGREVRRDGRPHHVDRARAVDRDVPSRASEVRPEDQAVSSATNASEDVLAWPVRSRRGSNSISGARAPESVRSP